MRMGSLYLGDPANMMSPWASPARTEDLSGLPPRLVITMEIGHTRDEAEDYARALSAAGVKTVCRRFDGLFHTAFSLSGAIPHATAIQETIAGFLVPLLSPEIASSAATPAKQSEELRHLRVLHVFLVHGGPTMPP